MVKVSLLAVSEPLHGARDPRRLVELAVKTSAGRVREKGWLHYFLAERDDTQLNEWLLKAAEIFPSVLEHISLTFMIEDISRVTSHQLVRHRIASYTQESLRYSVLANPNDVVRDGEFVVECVNTIDEKKHEECWNKAIDVLRKYFILPNGFENYTTAVELLGHSLIEYAVAMAIYGKSPEDARYVLPMAVKTRIMMTVNLRELLHIGCMRLSEHAQAEIREVTKKMFDEVEGKLSIPIWEMKEKFCRGE